MAAAAERVGRAPTEIRLLPISKTVSPDRVRLAARAGCHTFGENKVQEARQKSQDLADLDVAWSLVGHLQTNKVRDVAAFVTEFHALDSLRVAEALDRRFQKLGRGLDVYVQVNTSAETSKYGLPPQDVLPFLTELPRFSSLRVRGLMTLAVFTSEVDRVRGCFRLLRTIRDQARDLERHLIGPGELSMGMSGDFETAIEESATLVRIGQDIFGSRPLPDSHYWPPTSPS